MSLTEGGPGPVRQPDRNLTTCKPLMGMPLVAGASWVRQFPVVHNFDHRQFAVGCPLKSYTACRLTCLLSTNKRAKEDGARHGQFPHAAPGFAVRDSLFSGSPDKPEQLEDISHESLGSRLHEGFKEKGQQT